MKKFVNLILILCALGMTPALAGSGSTTSYKSLTEWVASTRQIQNNPETCFSDRIPGTINHLLALHHTLEAEVRLNQNVRLFTPKQQHVLQIHQRISAEEDFQS